MPAASRRPTKGALPSPRYTRSRRARCRTSTPGSSGPRRRRPPPPTSRPRRPPAAASGLTATPGARPASRSSPRWSTRSRPISKVSPAIDTDDVRRHRRHHALLVVDALRRDERRRRTIPGSSTTRTASPSTTRPPRWSAASAEIPRDFGGCHQFVTQLERVARGPAARLARSCALRATLLRPRRCSRSRSRARRARRPGASRLANLELPRESPVGKLSQQVGLTEIAVEYGSPAVAGRKIWGALVPFDKLWSLGGYQATKVRFSRDVTFGDKAVPAGTYALFAIPGKTQLDADPQQERRPARQRARLPQRSRRRRASRSTPRRRRSASGWRSPSPTSPTTARRWSSAWEKLKLSIPIRVNTTEEVLTNISSLDNTWRAYANAARYMLETKKNYDLGLTTSTSRWR